MTRPAQIVSGGQSGVDRAALEFAADHGIPYSGWCPRGGPAEDLPSPPGIRALYPQLRETPTDDPAERTLWNVRDSDATLVLRLGTGSSPGTDSAERAARELGRPIAVVDLRGSPREAQREVAPLLDRADGGSLNVAGPRESEAPGIQAAARGFLEQALTDG